MGASLGDDRYFTHCDRFADDDMGVPLEDVKTIHWGWADARQVRDLDPSKAIAVLVPARACHPNRGEPEWILFVRENLSESEIEQIFATFEGDKLGASTS